ncbi:hypothetical protein AYI68_g1063 [Smittium mucronatum]|uniref:Uncharacterized protein n=1 Tax=Smittium mucronatum TaxID=133383 RepID=A0A1R0H6G4_9FUNG|nr:hypothetical protein AYI68_g1063 [Smittium mucronatum]
MSRDFRNHTPPKNKFRVLKNKLQALKPLKAQQAKTWMIEVDVPLSPRYEFIEKSDVPLSDFHIFDQTGMYNNRFKSQFPIFKVPKSEFVNHKNHKHDLDSKKLKAQNNSVISLQNDTNTENYLPSTKSTLQVSSQNQEKYNNIYFDYNTRPSSKGENYHNSQIFSNKESSKNYSSITDATESNITTPSTNYKNNKSEPSFPSHIHYNGSYPELDFELFSNLPQKYNSNVKINQNISQSQSDLVGSIGPVPIELPPKKVKNKKFLNFFKDQVTDKNLDSYYPENYELITEEDYSSSVPRYFSKKIIDNLGFMVPSCTEIDQLGINRETVFDESHYLNNAENFSSNINLNSIPNPAKDSDFKNIEESTYYSSRKSSQRFDISNISLSNTSPKILPRKRTISYSSNNLRDLDKPIEDSNFLDNTQPNNSLSPYKAVIHKVKSSNRRKRVIYGKLCEGLQSLNSEKKPTEPLFSSILKDNNKNSTFLSLSDINPGFLIEDNHEIGSRINYDLSSLINHDLQSPINPFSEDSPIIGFSSEIFMESKNKVSNFSGGKEMNPLNISLKEISHPSAPLKNSKPSHISKSPHFSPIDSKFKKISDCEFFLRNSHPGKNKNFKNLSAKKSIIRRMDKYTIDIPTTTEIFSPNESNTNSLRSYYDRLGVSDLLKMFPTEIPTKRFLSSSKNPDLKYLISSTASAKNNICLQKNKNNLTKPSVNILNKSNIIGKDRHQDNYPGDMFLEASNSSPGPFFNENDSYSPPVLANGEFLWYTSMDNSYRDEINRNLDAVLNIGISGLQSHHTSLKSLDLLDYKNKSGLALKDPEKYYNRISLESSKSLNSESSKSDQSNTSDINSKRKSKTVSEISDPKFISKHTNSSKSIPSFFKDRHIHLDDLEQSENSKEGFKIADFERFDLFDYQKESVNFPSPKMDSAPILIHGDKSHNIPRKPALNMKISNIPTLIMPNHPYVQAENKYFNGDFKGILLDAKSQKDPKSIRRPNNLKIITNRYLDTEYHKNNISVTAPIHKKDLHHKLPIINKRKMTDLNDPPTPYMTVSVPIPSQNASASSNSGQNAYSISGIDSKYSSNLPTSKSILVDKDLFENESNSSSIVCFNDGLKNSFEITETINLSPEYHVNNISRNKFISPTGGYGKKESGSLH